MIKSLVYLIFLFSIVNANEADCVRMNYLPMPNELSCGKEVFNIEDPCKIFFHVKIEEKSHEHVAELIEFQMKASFKCSLPNYILAPKLEANLIGFAYKVEVNIADPALKSAFTVEEESYQLNINKDISKI